MYAALAETKSQAASAVMALLADVREDHAHLPRELVFRLHSDRGQELLPEALEAFCRFHAIKRTTTAGYDPSANGAAESSIGYLKRKSRHLLSGARLPTCWWGTAVLAAAHYSRCAAGLLEWPSLPYGTRAMVVKGPPARNAFMPRSMPATILGASERVPGGLIVFQDGALKEQVNVQTTSLEPEEIVWVKAHLRDFDHPIAPMDPPAVEAWDPKDVDKRLVAPGGRKARKGAGPSGDFLLDRPEAAEIEAPNPEERAEDPRMTTAEVMERIAEAEDEAKAFIDQYRWVPHRPREGGGRGFPCRDARNARRAGHSGHETCG